MGAALSFLGQKLFASSTLISARCENISCCTSVAAPVVRRTGGFLRKGVTTIYVDSRKRVAGSDSDFEVDLGESLHLQSDARLAVYKIRIADSFLSTDRGCYLYWVDAALSALNWALLPEGAYTGKRNRRQGRLLPEECSTSALKSVSHWKEKPMGAALSFLGQKLFASSTLSSARFENISCCTSVAAVHPPIIRRTGGFLKKRMTTIYVDSRTRGRLGQRLRGRPGGIPCAVPLDGPGPLPLLG